MFDFVIFYMQTFLKTIHSKRYYCKSDAVNCSSSYLTKCITCTLPLILLLQYPVPGCHISQHLVPTCRIICPKVTCILWLCGNVGVVIAESRETPSCDHFASKTDRFNNNLNISYFQNWSQCAGMPKLLLYIMNLFALSPDILSLVIDLKFVNIQVTVG